MAEETVAELVAEISADVDEFEQGINKVETRLDDLEKKEVSVTAETKGVETSVSSLGTEMALLGGSLATVFTFLQQNSGALSALTGFATGLIGAGLDTFFVEILLPLWDEFKEKVSDGEEGTDEFTGSLEELASQFLVTKDGMIKLKDGAEGPAEALRGFKKLLRDGKVDSDELADSVIKIGDQILIFDDKTGEFLGTTEALDGQIAGLNANMAIADSLIDDLAAEYQVSGAAIKEFMESGLTVMETILQADPNDFPGTAYISRVGDAAEQVRLQLATMLVALGINPLTGESIVSGDIFGSGVSSANTFDENVQKLAAFLLSGGD